MKIASNRLSDLYTFYKNELHSIYDDGELYSIFELVCQKFLNYSKQDVKQNFNENINQSNLINIYNTAVELKKQEPLQYILKEAFFYDSLFYVNPSVLIPRPETEELVDMILKTKLTTEHRSNLLSILDIGTGSGCIPITLNKHLPNYNVFGIDISEKALEVAITNAKTHQVEIPFKKIDILKTSLESVSKNPFSIIVSNPPYIPFSEAKEMDQRVLENEPHIALFVENDNPIIFYTRIIDLCREYLEERGYLFFELNPVYAEQVKNYATESKLFSKIDLIKDMSGKLRVLKAQK